MQTSGLHTRQRPSQPFSSAADKQLQTSSHRQHALNGSGRVSIKLYLQHSWGAGFVNSCFTCIHPPEPHEYSSHR